MAKITKIKLAITTVDARTATGTGTDGAVYLGIGGREFRCDNKSEEDLEAGKTSIFIFGDNTTVKEPELNDPADPYILNTDTLDKFPKYIRFEPHGQNDNWYVEGVNIHINPGQSSSRTINSLDGNQKIWLGYRNGKFLYFP